MSIKCFVACVSLSIALGLQPIASANILLNAGFETGINDTAAWWTNVSGPSGSAGRSSSMPGAGASGAYLQADHINNPAAVTPYAIEQFQPTGTIDDSLNYNLSFSAKAESSDFTGFDMGYQILWLDGNLSHGGGVVGEFYESLLPAGLNTGYQTFSLNNLDVPTGADSFRLRFELLPGAVDGITNGLFIDDVVMEPIGGVLPPSDPNNLLQNAGFETGIGDTAAWWTNIAGPSGSAGRSGAMPGAGDSGAYLQADHINNPAAVTPYGVEQLLPAGTIDDSLTYDLSFSAKADSEDFTGFDMIYQILWLDGDVSHGGGVLGEVKDSLLPAGIDTEYQTFNLNDLEVPVGADSLRLRFELIPGAVAGVANGFSIDEVVFSSSSDVSLAGDYNNDGVVDAADYTVWRDNLGAAAGTLPNDVDGGVIDTDQYTTWSNNFGAQLPSSTSAVPEPSALAVACSLGWLLTATRRRCG